MQIACALVGRTSQQPLDPLSHGAIWARWVGLRNRHLGLDLRRESSGSHCSQVRPDVMARGPRR